MKITTAFIAISLIIYSATSASEPIHIGTNIFECWSLNKNYSLVVIPQDSKICFDWEPNPSAIAFVKMKGNKEPLYFFKVKYENWYNYIISESGETVIQFISYKNYAGENPDGTSKHTDPFSEINVYSHGILQKSFTLNIAFCTYSTKTMYQDHVLDIDDSKYLNLIDENLYVVSDTSIIKINIQNGETRSVTDAIILKSYRYKFKKVRAKHIKKYNIFDMHLALTKRDLIP